ncbi:hypothetical protein CYMTET_54057 [Cymbomonas tetramitiformis]|uniref:Uncharacterized protein n=1 Tax=Cymbomonas tetramitiformis TaxID=36881 RepID=A0AAE0EP55_9CHLO|nr:hypothetical protein CYMTET_54057 [Cymbomonas tetramitiformis]
MVQTQCFVFAPELEGQCVAVITVDLEAIVAELEGLSFSSFAPELEGHCVAVITVDLEAISWERLTFTATFIEEDLEVGCAITIHWEAAQHTVGAHPGGGATHWWHTQLQHTSVSVELEGRHAVDEALGVVDTQSSGLLYHAGTRIHRVEEEPLADQTTWQSEHFERSTRSCVASGITDEHFERSTLSCVTSGHHRRAL